MNYGCRIQVWEWESGRVWELSEFNELSELSELP